MQDPSGALRCSEQRPPRHRTLIGEILAPRGQVLQQVGLREVETHADDLPSGYVHVHRHGARAGDREGDAGA